MTRGQGSRPLDRDRRDVQPDDFSDVRCQAPFDRAVAASEAEDPVRSACARGPEKDAGGAIVNALEKRASLDPCRVGCIVKIVIVALVHRHLPEYTATLPAAKAACCRLRSHRGPSLPATTYHWMPSSRRR